MRRRAAALSLLILLILSALQTISDYKYETDAERLTASSVHAPVYTIYVDIEDKTLYLLENGKCIKQYPIASGKSGLPSPLGCWKVVEKSDWGEGFGGRWLGLDVPWGT